MEERLHPLDPEALAVFAAKGREAGPGAPQTGPANGLKVRRVLQLTRDLAGRPLAGLRILDLGCGEGVYAIEAGVRGAEVLAVDARTERMGLGAACAARHGLGRVRFVQDDARRVTRATHGEFDVVYLLGLLYHLDAPEVFTVLEQVHELCRGLLVVDTLISPAGELEIPWRDRVYRGQRCREHGDDDPPEMRRRRVLRSIDSTFAVRFTRESLARVLRDVGFTSVLEAHVPSEPDKAPDRITVAALKGTPVRLSTYPWVNHRTEAELERILRDPGPARA